MVKIMPKDVHSIGEGELKVIYCDFGVHIFWNGQEVTKGAGLNIGINTLGLWTNSTKADWKVVGEGKNFLKLKITQTDLPLIQTWVISIRDKTQIEWQVDLEAQEWLHIDEFRILCLVSPCYKNWIINYQEKDFPRPDKEWRDLFLGASPVSLIGARFPQEANFLPSLTLEAQEKEFLPIVQSPPLEVDGYIIGFRSKGLRENKDYPAGTYRLFYGKITLFKNDRLLDHKVEMLRQQELKERIKEEKARRWKKELRVLLVNLPWYKNGKWGVRAGSRWPHIKDESEGNYLPFPFFLAHATSLLQKNGISADLIDAIAEQLSEEDFLRKIAGMNFDILVAETSTPSFYDDLNILQKISSLGVPIILCGPHIEIYQPHFLKEHPFIDFVLSGEYEFMLLELIKNLQKNNSDLSGINGLLWHNKAGQAIKNRDRLPGDINLLPWPYRDGLPMQKYWDLPGDIPHPSLQMLASRGCPFGCHFCLWPQLMYQGNHYRARNVEDVVDEMEYFVREKGFRSVYFDDDTFNVGKERMLAFCRALKERGLEDVPWAIMARADLMDEKILTEMKSAGIRTVKYGVESCSQSLIKNCRKNMSVDKTTRMIKATSNLGIKFHLTFCFGMDGETKDTIQRSIDYALSMEPDSVQFSILTPFPGTALFAELDKAGRILTKDWSEYDGHHSCVFRPSHLTVQDLEVAKRKAYHLWADYQRKKRGLAGDLKRFHRYLKDRGLKYTVNKTADYLRYVLFNRRKYLSGNY